MIRIDIRAVYIHTVHRLDADVAFLSYLADDARDADRIKALIRPVLPRLLLPLDKKRYLLVHRYAASCQFPDILRPEINICIRNNQFIVYRYNEHAIILLYYQHSNLSSANPCVKI